MLCERCGIREANIKYTEIVNGVRTEHNLCTHCAREMDLGQYSAILDGEFPLGKLLSGLLGLENTKEETDECSKVVCPTCGTTFDDFVRDSRFGCPDCYGVFDLIISDKIKQLQGSVSHKGKHPHVSEVEGGPEQPEDLEKEMQEADREQSSRQDWEDRILALEEQLKDAVRREDYELAARCRDEIRALKEGMKQYE